MFEILHLITLVRKVGNESVVIVYNQFKINLSCLCVCVCVCVCRCGSS